MKSLFLRIFLSFWMAQALFVVLAIVVTLAFQPRGSSWDGLRATALNESVSAYEEGGAREAADYLNGLLATQHVRAFFSMSVARKFLCAARPTGRFAR
jgi:hypothetical protein